MNNIDTSINSDSRTLLNKALKEIMPLINAEGGTLFLFDPNNKELVLDSAYSHDMLDLRGIRKSLGEGVSGKVVDIRSPILVTDINSDTRFNFRRNGFRHYKTNSFISIPLFTSKGLLGLMNFTDKVSGDAFSEKDLKLAVTISQYACTALESTYNFSIAKEEDFSQNERFHNILGKDEKMRKIYSLINDITKTRATVLIHGESGTGKRLIAHAVHKYNEHEREKPFVEVSCGALTDTLLESELFGHVKGAFTGAIKDKIGRFELADGGTIFLDEIDAFSPLLQVKLLRVLQDGELERVGDNHTIKIDVRVIAATNQKLEELIAAGKFRKDLFYRLNIISIEVPPLRDRKQDIPLLANDFIRKHNTHFKKRIDGFSPEALELLMNYNWPGNIRELENVVERAVILSKGNLIVPGDFPESLINFKAQVQSLEDHAKNGCQRLKHALKMPEKELILKALDSVDWNRNKAAKYLSINRTTLYKKMRHFGLLTKSKN